MSAELHLPDLPEVPVILGPEPGGPKRAPVPWSERLRQLLLNYLPLLLLLALALGSWWLLRQAPKPLQEAAEVALRHEPDYELDRFAMKRWSAEGVERVRVEGSALRHFPDTDELEVDALRLWLRAPAQRLTEATARQAVVDGKATVARLEGDVQVTTQGPGQEPPAIITGQRFVVRIPERQVSTSQPVRVRQGRSEFSADALDYDATKGLLDLHGKVRVVIQPMAGKR